MTAEIVAGVMARMVMEKKYGSNLGEDLIDTPALYVEHSKYFSKYLTRCHRQLVADAAIR